MFALINFTFLLKENPSALWSGLLELIVSYNTLCSSKIPLSLILLLRKCGMITILHMCYAIKAYLYIILILPARILTYFPSIHKCVTQLQYWFCSWNRRKTSRKGKRSRRMKSILHECKCFLMRTNYQLEGNFRLRKNSEHIHSFSH